jgi:hypothetical protein
MCHLFKNYKEPGSQQHFVMTNFVSVEEKQQLLEIKGTEKSRRRSNTCKAKEGTPL